MNRNIKTVKIILQCGLIFILTTAGLAQEAKIGDHGDGSRSVPVHLIKLVDEDSSVVRVDDQPMLPFSTNKTCGSCHDYQKIRGGWHFNAGDSAAVSGRNAHPWILSDQNTGTQIPVSYRNWPGVFRPEDLGLNGLEYLQLFARQMPGGSVGDNDYQRDVSDIFRWRVSGDLEVNCLSCHDAEFSHDQAAFAANTTRQNFRWAATASSGLANGYGSARDMPDNYDIYLGTAPDLAKKTPPHVVYDLTRFNDLSEVYLDVVRKVPDANCYFCHSTKPVDTKNDERWQHDADVHLSAGLHCVDCHRNGLDHDMIRGYETEIKSGSITKADFSCAGCHLVSGKLGAPRPLHEGLPIVHLEKLTCTTCHSGPLPAENTGYVKTSMAHALGVHGANKADSALPHIYSPVFVRNENGLIAPHNLFWPAYWALQKGDTLVPFPVKQLSQYISPFVINDDSLAGGDWLALADSQIVAVLDTMTLVLSGDRKPVYIAGSKIYSLLNDSTLIGEENKAAQPYSWPIAHDVRPAAQALGSGGCQDCHSLSAPFFYSRFSPDSPVGDQESAGLQNIDLMDVNRAGTWVFSSSFLFRPWLKIAVIVLTIVLVMVLLIYFVKALRFITESLGK